MAELPKALEKTAQAWQAAEEDEREAYMAVLAAKRALKEAQQARDKANLKTRQAARAHHAACDAYYAKESVTCK